MCTTDAGMSIICNSVCSVYDIKSNRAELLVTSHSIQLHKVTLTWNLYSRPLDIPGHAELVPWWPALTKSECTCTRKAMAVL